uniref:S5 DRBM domain-containing protein n=4 Tax=Aegilops tauschii subsp. strangulata TaxID=200361 RepID=A0A453GCJ5_AEGTS
VVVPFPPPRPLGPQQEECGSPLQLLLLKDEVMKITPVQKQTRAGQCTRFKAFVVGGDSNGHVGLGVKCAKEAATAIRGAIILAKLSIVPVRRGYWGNKNGQPHTVPSLVRAESAAKRWNFRRRKDLTGSSGARPLGV